MFGIDREEIKKANKRLEEKRRQLKDDVDVQKLYAGAEHLGVDWFADESETESGLGEGPQTGLKAEAGGIRIEKRGNLYRITSTRAAGALELEGEEFSDLEEAIRRIKE